jgi:hypothetical protein
MALFLISLAVAIHRQRRGGGLFRDNDVLLCDQCTQPSRANNEMRCACGGLLEDFDHYDWVPEGEIANVAGHEEACDNRTAQ